MAHEDPVRSGRFWLFPDGTVLPVVAGGADDGDGDPNPEGGTGGAPAGGAPANDPAAVAAELARTREALKKANQEAASNRKKLQELDDKDKSELQKAVERAEAAESRADQAESRILRLEVAASKGLTPAQAKRLVGASKEELEADADELLATFKPSTTDPGGDGAGGDGDGERRPDPVGRPKPNLEGGGDPTRSPDPDMRKVVEGIPRSLT